jgi:hypothetical protein
MAGVSIVDRLITTMLWFCWMCLVYRLGTRNKEANGSWKLEAGSWKMEAGSWKHAARLWGRPHTEPLATQTRLVTQTRPATQTRQGGARLKCA